eukprot:scaffold195744_cov37-Tisochrysis_lutea.AAC.3
MELTEDYHERSSLFGIKTLFQFLGYAAAPALGLGLTAAYGDDLVALYSVQSFVFGGLALFAYVVRPPPSPPTTFAQATTANARLIWRYLRPLAHLVLQSPAVVTLLLKMFLALIC